MDVWQENHHRGSGSSTPPPLSREPEPIRRWRDVFWLAVFLLHMLILGSVLGAIGFNRFRGEDRLNLDRYTKPSADESSKEKTEKYWPICSTAAGIGALIAWAWLSFLCRKGNQMMRFSVHSVTTYLALISVFCFWINEIFWGIGCAVGATLQFLYILSVMDRYFLQAISVLKTSKFYVILVVSCSTTLAET